MHYQIKKNAVMMILTVFILTGCGGSKSGAELESYAVSGEEVSENENRYEYLTSINLKKDQASLRVYLPDGEFAEKSESKACSAMEGITVETELIEDESGISVSSISEAEFAARQSHISQLPGAQDITAAPESAGEGISIRQTVYNINDGNGSIYPCTVIIKADHIKDTYYLKTVVTVDNMTASEKTETILKETMDAFGLLLS